MPASKAIITMIECQYSVRIPLSAVPRVAVVESMCVVYEEENKQKICKFLLTSKSKYTIQGGEDK